MRKQINLIQRAYIVFLLALQIFIPVAVCLALVHIFPVFKIMTACSSILIALWIAGGERDAEYRLLWVLILILLPSCGFLLWLMIGMHREKKHFTQRLRQNETRLAPLLPPQLPADRTDLAALPEPWQQLTKLIEQMTGIAAYGGCSLRFFSCGETFYPAYLEVLKQAHHFIWLEYYIIQENGVFWHQTIEILRQKAKEGLDVRVLYDDFGCFLTLSSGFADRLRHEGIHCRTVNPFRPMLSLQQNRRDHRKLTIIDGEITFTGGLNLADEYINLRPPQRPLCGYWKDFEVELRGRGAAAFTPVFLSMWELGDGAKHDRPSIPKQVRQLADHVRFFPQSGVVQPFCDRPDLHLSEQMTLFFIASAKKTLTVSTPYLIPNAALVAALSAAARSGVCVKIITPSHPDQRIVRAAMRSGYASLLRAGVQIYEYAPGFIHAKCLEADEECAIIGTVNLDYRSFNLTYECGVCLYGREKVRPVAQELRHILTQCTAITELQSRRWASPLRRHALRLLRPLI